MKTKDTCYNLMVPNHHLNFNTIIAKWGGHQPYAALKFPCGQDSSSIVRGQNNATPLPRSSKAGCSPQGCQYPT